MNIWNKNLSFFTWTLHEKCKLFLLRVVRLMETAWHGNNRECAGKWDIHGNLLLFVHCHLFLSRYATQSCWHSTEINYVWLSRFLDSEFSVELSKILSIDLLRRAQISDIPCKKLRRSTINDRWRLKISMFHRRALPHNNEIYQIIIYKPREIGFGEIYCFTRNYVSSTAHRFEFPGKGRTKNVVTLSRDNYKIWFSEGSTKKKALMKNCLWTKRNGKKLEVSKLFNTDWERTVFIEFQACCYRWPKPTCCVADERWNNDSDEPANNVSVSTDQSRVRSAKKCTLRLHGNTNNVHKIFVTPWNSIWKCVVPRKP